MPTAEWSVAFDLVTSEGTLLFNQGAYPRFNIDRSRCRVRRDIRAITDPIPQGDGDIFHDRYASGIEMTINCQPWLSTEQFACEGLELGGTSLVTMRDLLYQHLWALLRPIEAVGTMSFQHRIIWTPTGQARRMLNDIRLLDISDPTISEEGLVSFEFTVDTPFPYAMSETETTQTLLLGVPTVIANNGNVDFYPVIRVNGPTSAFTISNDDTGEDYVYDSARPGAQAIGIGDYGEIDMFRGGIIYLNGNQANLKPGVDPELSSILFVQPGGNQFTLTGAVSADFLLNDAWA